MPTIYALKPRFQSLLRPWVQRLYARGVTANQVTIAACAVSVLIGLLVAAGAEYRTLFALVPIWMVIRMALNAIDGMLARECGQKSILGTYLNELADVLSDAALYWPFAYLPHFPAFWVGAAILLAVTSEYAGVLGVAVGASRRYDGPMGKSDRAFIFGLLGVAIAVGLAPSAWLALVMPLVCGLTALTIVNRVRGGLAEASAR